MDEYIKKGDALKIIFQNPSRIACFTSKAVHLIENLPSNKNVVEVIRCKDCGASRSICDDVIYCACFGIVVTNDHFCSKGYKKEVK